MTRYLAEYVRRGELLFGIAAVEIVSEAEQIARDADAAADGLSHEALRTQQPRWE